MGNRVRTSAAVAVILLVSGCGKALDGSDGATKDASTAEAAAPDGHRDAGAADGGPDAATLMTDAQARDADMPAIDASADCTLRAQTCPVGCRRFVGHRYSQERMCIEDVWEVVGCISEVLGEYDDPRCARKKDTGEIFRVPLSFLDPSRGSSPPGPNWTSCSPRDDNFVSSTVTPSCDDLEDGGVYDGAP
jgi:hypothetical protein